jgi:mitochondrial fission protein ELM1
MTALKNKLRVCWLKDKRLGHLTKIDGVLKALMFHYEIEVEEIEVVWRPKFLRTCARLLPRSYLQKTLERMPEDSVDLVVSAGGATEWPNAILAKRLHVPNIYIGSCRTCKEEDFMILPRFEGSAKNVLSLDVSPSKVDQALVQRAAETELSELTATYWTVLLGGDCKGCTWTEKDWTLQMKRIISEARKAHVQLLVTSSPRTGKSNEHICEKLLLDSGLLARGVWFGTKDINSPSMLAMLGKADRVIVSEDSASMVNEAVLARKPVATISPTLCKLPARNERMLMHLEQKKYIVRLQSDSWDLAKLNPTQWTLASSDWYYEFGMHLKERIDNWIIPNEN